MNPNNVVSLEDRLPTRHFKWGDKIEYEMPSEIEYSLRLISRLHNTQYDPNRFFEISYNHLDKLFREDMFDFIEAVNLAAVSDWVCEDFTKEKSKNNLEIELKKPDIFNELYEQFYHELNPQEITDIVYSFFISSFFQSYNENDEYDTLIPFEDKKKLRKEAMRNSDTEAIDYLSQNTFHGVSPTRLIGDRKYWDL